MAVRPSVGPMASSSFGHVLDPNCRIHRAKSGNLSRMHCQRTDGPIFGLLEAWVVVDYEQIEVDRRTFLNHDHLL